MLAGGELATVALASQTQKQVLVLYSTRRDSQIVAIGERELPRLLDHGLGEGVDYYSEYIDRLRFPDVAAQAPAFRDFLRLKYQHHRFDVVVAMDDIARDFLDAYREALFPDVPIVFFSSQPHATRLPNSTGVVAHLNLADTLRLARRLQPDLQQAFVISSASSGHEQVARAQFPTFDPPLSIVYLTGLATKDLEARLASLPPRSIIYYLTVDRDGAGGNVHPLEYLDRLTAIADAPIYCWVDSAMGRGIVGGSLKSQLAEIHAVGEMALRVLHGERADSIPLASPDLNVTQVDWRELRRWGIPTSRVPANTVIRFQQISVWDRYKAYILAAIAIVLGQALLIAGLLVQGARRRRAEAQVRESQGQLHASYARIRDLGGRLLTAQDSERSRIARDLHDDIGQQMALLTIDLELLRAADRAQGERLALDALSHAHGVAKSLHDLSHRLHPAKLRLLGLVTALKTLVHELPSSPTRMIFTHEHVPATLSPEVTLCVFRVVQEAVQNALKHSGAREVAVRLTGSPQGLVLTVADNGVGFDVETAWGKGLGLISMRERLEALGGTFELHAWPGAGTRLSIHMPVGVEPLPILHSPPSTQSVS